MEHPILSLEDITVGYGGDNILKNISLALPKGVFVGLLGSNGSGKTTLFKLISGELTDHTGKIFYNGIDISKSSIISRIASGIIYIHQFPTAFPDLPVWETFMIWSSVIPGKKKYELNRESIVDYLTRELSTAGLSLPFHKIVNELSEQELQILEFSRCLIVDPHIILIDETTSVLDSELSLKILLFLQSMNQKGTAILFISHRLEELQKFSSLIYQLKEKRISVYESSEQPLSYNVVLKPERDADETQPLLLDCDILDGERIITFNLSVGDILGFTGLQGSHYEHLPDLLCSNLKQNKTGKGYSLGHTFSYLGKDRKRDWIFPLLSLKFNLAIAGKELISGEDTFPIAAIAKQYQIEPIDLEKSAIEFSGGNKLKIALARTLLLHCPVNILDEPFTGIDAQSRQSIIDIIKRDAFERQSAFIIFSKDYKELLRLCNRIIVFKNDGTTRELRSFSFEGIHDDALEDQLFN